MQSGGRQEVLQRCEWKLRDLLGQLPEPNDYLFPTPSLPHQDEPPLIYGRTTEEISSFHHGDNSRISEIRRHSRFRIGRVSRVRKGSRAELGREERSRWLASPTSRLGRFRVDQKNKSAPNHNGFAFGSISTQRRLPEPSSAADLESQDPFVIERDLDLEGGLRYRLNAFPAGTNFSACKRVRLRIRFSTLSVSEV
jgi:hypothetical protein